VRTIRPYDAETPINHVTWTRNGRSLLLSSLKDVRLQRYDIVTNRIDRTVTLAKPIRFSAVHPRNAMQCICAIVGEEPSVVDLSILGRVPASSPTPASKNDITIGATNDKSTNGEHDSLNATMTDATNDNNDTKSDGSSSSDTSNGKRILIFDSKRVPAPVSSRVSKSSSDERNVIATYDKLGEHIYVGSTRGAVTIYNSSTLELVRAFRLASAQEVKQIEFSPTGAHFLINCHDRVIRVFDTKTYAFSLPSHYCTYDFACVCN
jgi:WD40 repeat protein